MRKLQFLLPALLCLVLAGYAPALAAGKTGNVTYDINLKVEKAPRPPRCICPTPCPTKTRTSPTCR